VNVYAVETVDGVILIDCGVDWDPGHSTLMHGLVDLGLEPDSVRFLIVSHLHPDHVGMAGRVVEELGCELVMHRRAATLYRRYNDTAGTENALRSLAISHGVPDDIVDAISAVGPRPDFMPQIGPPDIVVDDGDRVELGEGRYLEVLFTPGHEASHICLRDSQTGILFSGDHVLPRITPVLMYDDTVEDTVGDYLNSLNRLIALHIGLTYPAHGSIIERGTQRCEQILLHRLRRISGILEVIELGPATSWHVLNKVYRPGLQPMEQRLALRETVAQLEHLRITDRAGRFIETGVWWYRST
jgi:glyoxylase-like metal-dependent hydrolase (beta-lactamase superfamily II)